MKMQETIILKIVALILLIVSQISADFDAICDQNSRSICFAIRTANSSKSANAFLANSSIMVAAVRFDPVYDQFRFDVVARGVSHLPQEQVQRMHVALQDANDADDAKNLTITCSKSNDGQVYVEQYLNGMKIENANFTTLKTSDAANISRNGQFFCSFLAPTNVRLQNNTNLFNVLPDAHYIELKLTTTNSLYESRTKFALNFCSIANCTQIQTTTPAPPFRLADIELPVWMHVVTIVVPVAFVTLMCSCVQGWLGMKQFKKFCGCLCVHGKRNVVKTCEKNQVGPQTIEEVQTFPDESFPL